MIRNYLDAFSSARSVTHRLMAGADHALSGVASRKAFGSLVTGWFAERVAPVPEARAAAAATVG